MIAAVATSVLVAGRFARKGQDIKISIAMKTIYAIKSDQNRKPRLRGPEVFGGLAALAVPSPLLLELERGASGVCDNITVEARRGSSSDKPIFIFHSAAGGVDESRGRGSIKGDVKRKYFSLRRSSGSSLTSSPFRSAE